MQKKFDAHVLRNRIRLPFRGPWKAVNAAQNASNMHSSNRNPRFAVDWLKVDSAGSSHKGDGKSSPTTIATEKRS
jgi:hypothetical protein